MDRFFVTMKDKHIEDDIGGPEVISSQLDPSKSKTNEEFQFKLFLRQSKVGEVCKTHAIDVPDKPDPYYQSKRVQCSTVSSMSQTPRPSNHMTDLPASKRQRPNAYQTIVLNDELLRPFERLRNIGTGSVIVSKNTWNDNDLRKQDFLDLDEFKRCNREMQLRMLERALSCLTCHVTAMDVGYLLSCAWCLRSCENPDDMVFKDYNMFKVATPIQSLSNEFCYKRRSGEPVIAPRELALQDAWIKSACYMCAASLRLITKDHNNLGKAWTSIENQFCSFYGHQIAFKINIDTECARQVRQLLLHHRLILKGSLAPFLLNVADLEGQDLRLVRVLFESHMSFTGMHSFILLLRCAVKLEVSVAVLSELIKHPGNKEALELAADLILNYMFPESVEEVAAFESRRRTWKYARIFDSQAFASLQTKNCTLLTSVLAVLAERCGIEGEGYATSIHQIAGMVSANFAYFDRMARRIIDRCTTTAGCSNE